MKRWPRISARARQLHASAIVVDTHIDTVLDLVNHRRRLGERSRDGHADLPRLREGGVDVQFFAHYIEPEYKPDRALPRFLELLDAFLAEAEACSEHMRVVTSYRELIEMVEQGK
ncbi:MAG TPA: membrane dipeptidase, partial [Bacillota bacterium]